MKSLIGLCIVALLGLMVTSAPANAGPPAGRILTTCTAGFIANPGWYTAAQLNGIGVKYMCSRNLPPGSNSPFTANFKLACNAGFSPLKAGSGDDSPHIEPSGKAIYFCISSGPH
jgi:hypothetical protein